MIIDAVPTVRESFHLRRANLAVFILILLLFVAIFLANLFLAKFPCFVYIFMAFNLIPLGFQHVNLSIICKSIYSVDTLFEASHSMIEYAYPVLAHKICHCFFALCRNCDAIAWHQVLP